MWKLCILSSFILLTAASDLHAGTVETAKERLNLVIQYLQELEGEVKFNDDSSELKFVKAQREL